MFVKSLRLSLPFLFDHLLLFSHRLSNLLSLLHVLVPSLLHILPGLHYNFAEKVLLLVLEDLDFAALSVYLWTIVVVGHESLDSSLKALLFNQLWIFHPSFSPWF